MARWQFCTCEEDTGKLKTAVLSLSLSLSLSLFLYLYLSLCHNIDCPVQCVEILRTAAGELVTLLHSHSDRNGATQGVHVSPSEVVPPTDRAWAPEAGG